MIKISRKTLLYEKLSFSGQVDLKTFNIINGYPLFYSSLKNDMNLHLSCNFDTFWLYMLAQCTVVAMFADF